MEKIPLLHLRLEGPMQSWGTRGRWNVRDTAMEPTKSGIIGLIACAMGCKRNDPQLEELSQKLTIGVRVEKPGKIEVDYHTVSRWQYINNRLTISPLKTAEGKYDKRKTTELIYKSYIQDSSFLVLVAGPLNLLKKIEGAFQDPKWPVYLGRKSCPPIRPVLEKLTQLYSSVKDALCEIPWSCEDINYTKPPKIRCIIDDIEGTMQRQDVIQINPARLYGMRRVSEFWVETPSLQS
ncbi:hypothetical protein LCGC14_0885030 [marine sediment metagenome]|uniref:CRISPR-associated protein Cas5 n=1 Tax=marine sediment metagenome TaxID=412755 RepID=A0A0F9S7T0_9ZZZZ